MNWIALFSQTGSEIKAISEQLGRWPDTIITNNRDVDAWSSNIPRDNVIAVPTTAINEFFENYDKECIVTLHGYLRILPGNICDKHEIYNGHPGLITIYPELKGKDPQEKVWENVGAYPVIGSVVHRCTSELDGGEIIQVVMRNNTCNSRDDLYNKLKETSLESWLIFLKGKFMTDNNAIRPDHYITNGYSCIDVIEDLCKDTKNDTFTDYNRFQSFKYIWRAGNKGDVLQDLKKAKQFLDFAIAYEEKKNG